MNKCLISFLLTTVTLLSCTDRKGTGTSTEGDTLRLEYAKLLTIVEKEGHTDVEIRDPWNTGKTLRRYCLCQKGNKAHCEEKETSVVHVPLQNAAAFTSVHCALIQELGVEDAIAGVCDSKYIHLPFVDKGLQDGSIIDLGNGLSPNVEAIIALQPDALMISPFENNEGYGRMESLCIPIIECADYMEVGPLARAEWIRLYGRLFGTSEKADSIFAKVKSDYNNICSKVSGCEERPSMICELPVSGQWYMPKGESTMGMLYTDAGANYLFADKHGAGNVALSIEHVLERANNADIWLIKHHGAITHADIVNDFPLLTHIKSAIWVCNTENTGFYEETPFHPEYLLSNLVEIFHPTLGVKAKKNYYHRLK